MRPLPFGTALMVAVAGGRTGARGASTDQTPASRRHANAIKIAATAMTEMAMMAIFSKPF